jgi:hypothetical protein
MISFRPVRNDCDIFVCPVFTPSFDGVLKSLEIVSYRLILFCKTVPDLTALFKHYLLSHSDLRLLSLLCSKKAGVLFSKSGALANCVLQFHLFPL